VIQHVMASCRGVREALAGAQREGAWLSAGPIAPGIRARARKDVYAVGNAAGEAHPLVAEGISMAIQSSWLLASALLDGNEADAASIYSREWKRHFAARVRASSLFAAFTTGAMARPSIAALEHIPALLTWGARWSGKAHSLRLAA